VLPASPASIFDLTAITTMSTQPICGICSPTGLPFLLLRKSVVATNPNLAPKGAEKLQPHAASSQVMGLPTLEHSKYILRLLRESNDENEIQGFLHVFHKVPRLINGKSKDWQVFRVKTGGALIPVEHPDALATTPFQCSQNPSHPHDVRLYILPDPLTASDIYFAYSANQWSEKQRKAMQADPDKYMFKVNVPQILAGKLPANAFAADAALVESHVAEYALDGFKIDNRPPFYAFACSAGQAQSLVRIMHGRTQNHPKLKDRACALVLPDPVGTTAELGDLVMARHMQGMSVAHLLAHPLGAAQAIHFIRDRIYESKLDQVQKDGRPLKAGELVIFNADMRDKDGNRVSATQQQKAAGQNYLIELSPNSPPIPSAKDLDQWLFVRFDNYNNFWEIQRAKGLPSTAHWYKLATSESNGMGGMGPLGIVIAPIEHMAALRTRQDMGKMNRIHDAKARENFEKYFQQEMEKVQDSIAHYDADRAKWLAKPWLKEYFEHHFDPKDANDPRNPARPVLPARIYMSEVLAAISGMGQPSASTETVLEELIGKSPQSPEGWVQRAMVGNQGELFGVLGSFVTDQANWYLSDDNKLDKTYDSLKGLLLDSSSNTKTMQGVQAIVGKYHWLTHAGIGLSFSVTGFAVGAGYYFAEKAADKARQAIAATPAGVKAIGMATALSTYATAQAQVLNALLSQRPPTSPVIVRMEVDMITLHTIVAQRNATGDNLNKTTRKRLADLANMSAGTKPPTLTLEFLTTEEAMKEAVKASSAMQEAAVVAAVTADKVRVPVRNLGAGAPRIWNVTAGEVAKLYQNAHRFDAFKKVSVSAGQGLRGTVLSLYGGLLTDGAGKFKILGNHEAMFGLFGAWLQWRVLQKNQAAVDKLKTKLESQVQNYTAEQLDAINYALALAQAGVADNLAGMTGGMMEVMGAGANAMRTLGVLPSAGFAAWPLGLASIAGGVGSFANAVQNWTRANKKSKEEDLLQYGYYGVSALYGGAGISLTFAGIETITYFLAKKQLLQSTMFRAGTSAAVRSFASDAGMAIMIGRGAVSLTGIGLVLTIGSFVIEGIVIEMDRNKLEAWVEKSYFGNKAQWRKDAGVNAQGKPSPGKPQPELWAEEQKAFMQALKDAQAESLANN
jgi:hypothetical protein